MKRILPFLCLLLGLLAPALAVVPLTIVGNAAYTVLPTDQRVATSVVFTAGRTWTLPSAGATCIGQTCPANALEIVDVANAVSPLFPMTIAPASNETINGSSSSVTFAATGGRVVLTPTGGSSWSMTMFTPNQTQIGGSTNATGAVNLHACGVVPIVVATGTDATAVNTETYIVELFVPTTTTLTGVAWLNLATSTGNVQFSLADATGKVITAAQTASTAAGTGAVWQQVSFATPYVAVGPAKYFVLMQNSGSNHYRAHTIGNCGASKKTGETFGTFTNVTAPTTFTTAIAPIIDTF